MSEVEWNHHVKDGGLLRYNGLDIWQCEVCGKLFRRKLS